MGFWLLLLLLGVLDPMDESRLGMSVRGVPSARGSAGGGPPETLVGEEANELVRLKDPSSA